MKTTKTKTIIFISLLLSAFLTTYTLSFAKGVTYDISTITTSGFTQINGTATDLKIGDSDIISFTEPNGGAIPIYVLFNFNGITDSEDIDICFYGRYQGSSAHQISVQAYNYTSTTWVTFGFILNSAVYGWVNSTIPLAYFEHFVSDETLSLRLFHTQNGISSHVLYIDTLYLDANTRDYLVFNDLAYSSSVAGSLCTFSTYIFEHEPDYDMYSWIFSTNNSGTWSNETAVLFTVQTGEWANVTKILNSNIGNVVAFRYYGIEVEEEAEEEQFSSAIEYITVTEKVTSPTINESTTSLFLFFGILGIFIFIPVLMLKRRSRR